MPAHWLMARLGKRVLRPGGVETTQGLIDRGGIGPEEHVVEFVDQTVRDIAYAWRTFRRAPRSALTIIATVALGLGLVTVVFTFYNAWFLQWDAVRD